MGKVLRQPAKPKAEELQPVSEQPQVEKQEPRRPVEGGQERKRRVSPFGARNILSVSNLDPNYQYRIISDNPGRLQWFLDRGYEVVTDDSHEIGDKVVDRGSKLGSGVTRNLGGGKTGILVRILKEYYVEDQMVKQESIDALEASMRPSDLDHGSLRIGKRKF